MRTRLVIPAALLVAAAYVKGRQDAILDGPPRRTPAPDPSAESILRAQAEAADAWELGLAEAEVAATAAPPAPAPPAARAPVFEPVSWIDRIPSFAPPAPEPRPARAAEAVQAVEAAPEPVAPPRRPVRADVDPALLAEWMAAPAGPAPLVEEAGRFALGGWAAQQGCMALCGVTFRERRDEAIPASRIRLFPEAMSNVGPAGLVVLPDAGFAPDLEGFTILVAASGPGAFAASGRYELLAAGPT